MTGSRAPTLVQRRHMQILRNSSAAPQPVVFLKLLRSSLVLQPFISCGMQSDANDGLQVSSHPFPLSPRKTTLLRIAVSLHTFRRTSKVPSLGTRRDQLLLFTSGAQKGHHPLVDHGHRSARRSGIPEPWATLERGRRCARLASTNLTLPSDFAPPTIPRPAHVRTIPGCDA